MMLKGLPSAAAGTASARLPSTRPVPSRKHVAFKGVRPSVRVLAAEAEPQQQQQRAPKQPKVYTVQVEDLKEGQELEGTVVSVEDYGAFVDFGAKVQGMIHVSKLAAGFVKNAKDIVKVGETVNVTILQVDAAKGRVSLALKGADAEPAEAQDVAPAGEAAGDVELDEDDFGVDLEEGQVEVRADLRGYDDVAIILDAADADELSEAAIAKLEADDEAVEVKYELDAPAYLAEVSGVVTRIEDFGLFVDFVWEGQNLSGLLAKEELKVPFSLVSVEKQAALKAEWAATGYEPPTFVALDDEEYDIKSYYKSGDIITAFVLDSDLEGRGIALTHFTDEEVAAEAADAFEGVEEEDEELLELLAEAQEGEDMLVSSPEELLEEEELDAEIGAALEDFETGGASTSRAAAGAILKNKNGELISPMGLPSRPLNLMDRSALAPVNVKQVDFDGDEIELFDYWAVEYTVPKKPLAKVGLKMSLNEAGEAVFTEREDFNGDLPVFSLNGDISERAAAFAEDLLDEEDEEELPIRAMRRPIVLAAAVSSISAATVKELREKTGAGMMDCKKALAECNGDMEQASEWLRKKGLAGADKKAGRIAAEGAIARYIHPGGRLGVLLEVNCETDFVAASEKFNALVNELGMIIASTDCVCVGPEDVPPELLAKEREVEMGKEDLANKPEAIRAKIVEGRLEKIKNNMALLNQPTLSDPNKTVAELVKETIAAVGENIKIRRFLKYRLGEGIEKKSTDFAAEVAQQTQAKAAAPKPAEPKKEEPKKEEPKKATVAVSASVVKELRDKTGAGMMDCKKALAENNGDMDAAVDWLRQKGLAGADKKAGRVAAEGVVAAYIHPGSRLGVLLEVNCETDFVAASEKFNELVNYIAMGIAAAQNVAYVSAEDIPAEVFEREKQLEMAREDLKSKPEAIRAKIAEGRARKIGEEMALLNQPYLVDQSKTVAEAIKEAIAAIGEKISVRRFQKFNLGEGLEKKSNDFAAEVAAATGKA